MPIGGIAALVTVPLIAGAVQPMGVNTVDHGPVFEHRQVEAAAVPADDLRGEAVDAVVEALDQRVVAGLGNIYVCEALFRSGIRPDKAAGKVTLPALKRLVPAIRDVLTESIAAGGSTIRDYAQPTGELGYFATSWQVYGREGEACLCGAPVLRFVQGGRSTFWCRKCQK